MSKYAVIRIKGSQYKVSEGDEILVGKLNGEKPDADVLLTSEEEKIKVGKPKAKGAKVALKVLVEEEKGTKLHVYKFKSKSRYRRKIGFRPVYTKLQVGRITI